MPSLHHAQPQYSAAVASVVGALPALPPHLRYVDDHDDTTKTIPHPYENNLWPLEWDTRSLTMDFTVLEDERLRFVAKWFIAWVVQNASPGSVGNYWYGLKGLVEEAGPSWLYCALDRRPLEWSAYWDEQIRPSATVTRASFVKAFLHFLSQLSLGEWRPGHRSFIQSLRFAWPETRKGVLSGEALISVSEEAELIAYFDKVSAQVRGGEGLSDPALLSYCLAVKLRPIVTP